MKKMLAVMAIILFGLFLSISAQALELQVKPVSSDFSLLTGSNNEDTYDSSFRVTGTAGVKVFSLGQIRLDKLKLAMTGAYEEMAIAMWDNWGTCGFTIVPTNLSVSARKYTLVEDFVLDVLPTALTSPMGGDFLVTTLNWAGEGRFFTKLYRVKRTGGVTLLKTWLNRKIHIGTHTDNSGRVDGFLAMSVVPTTGSSVIFRIDQGMAKVGQTKIPADYLADSISLTMKGMLAPSVWFQVFQNVQATVIQ